MYEEDRCTCEEGLQYGGISDCCPACQRDYLAWSLERDADELARFATQPAITAYLKEEAAA